MKIYVYAIMAFALAVVLVSCSTNSASPSAASDSTADAEHTRWLLECIKDMQPIKAGSTRAELMKVFTKAGGWSTPREATYVYRGCHYIAVDVVFETEADNEGRATERPDDKIIQISKPMVEITPGD